MMDDCIIILPHQLLKDHPLVSGDKEVYLMEEGRYFTDHRFHKKKLVLQDNVVKKVLKNAYAHHIERLMVLGNYMLLKEYDPNEIYRWFMEMFIDAYDWVMVPNVYGMSQYADGGKMATKPYVSSSNYLLKMSDFKKGEWCKKWDDMFWNFIGKNEEEFRSNPRMSLMVKILERRKKKADG